MTERILLTVTIVAAVGSAVVGGIMFAFSTSVMPALSRQPNASAAATMQSMNSTIENPLFLTAFLGTTLACAAVVVLSPIVGGRGTIVAVVAAAVFLVGAFGVTVVINVPLNSRLGAMDVAAAEQFWQEYLSRWTLWNHVRTVAAVVAAATLVTTLAVRR